MSKTNRISSYERERNKPLPDRIHGTIQAELSFFLNLKYRHQYGFASEVDLATIPHCTPDICIFPKRTLDILTVADRETEPPITTIDITSLGQSPDELVKKAYESYFPMGVQSAWIVLPALKAVQVLLPDNTELLFSKGLLKDTVTGIELSIEKIFEKLK